MFSPPLIVQSDRTIFLEVDNPLYESARDALAQFSELEKSPEHIHTYRITPLSIWNATATGLKSSEILNALEKFGKFQTPENLKHEIIEIADRYGKIILSRHEDALLLTVDDKILSRQIANHPKVIPLIADQPSECSFILQEKFRGEIKRVLTNLGFPVKDIAGYVDGTPFEINLRETTLSGQPYEIRKYQKEATENFYQGGGAEGGCGVVVLP